MSPGSVLVYSGRLLHKAGPNSSAVPRLGLIVEHVVRWLRPADCHPLAVGSALASHCPSPSRNCSASTRQRLLRLHRRPVARDWLAARKGSPA